jgi:magnesium/cobalt transport protein CorA
MEIFVITEGSTPQQCRTLDRLPDLGLVWLDFEREADPNWAREVERLTGVSVHEGHIKDSLNVRHPSFYDSTTGYEMIIFRSLAPESDEGQFASRATAFFLMGSMLVTVRPTDSRSIAAIKSRLLNGQGRIPRRSLGLMHQIMSAMVDRFLAMREPLVEQLDTWREELLDPRHPFDDWLALMAYRSQLRSLALLCEGQEDAIIQWRDNTEREIDDHLAVRFSDLREHILRVQRFAAEQQNEVESIVQLHFSAVAHRTNDIVRVLTVVSAIFLPLSLIAGIFGMNFEYMPELKYQYSYFIALGGMAALAGVFLIIFRIKRWI